MNMSIDEIKQQPNNSITDADSIRKIAIYSIDEDDSSLFCKIKTGYDFLGLYPNDVKLLNIKPDVIK